MHIKSLTIGIMLIFLLSISVQSASNASTFDINTTSSINLQGLTDGYNKEDIVVACYDDITVLLGNGTGGFPEQHDYLKGEGQADIITMDFDDDDDIDVAVTSYWDATITVYLNNGSGFFTNSQDYPVGTGVSGIDTGDFNEDNKPDIIVSNYEDINSITILYGDGLGGFGDRADLFVDFGLTDIVVDDFDNDTHQDLAVTQYLGQKIFVLFGDGTGSFSDIDIYPIGVQPYHITANDFNNDGAVDLAVTNYDQMAVGSLYVLLNDGAGGYAKQNNYPASLGTLGIVSNYFDDDPFVDVAVTNFIDGTFIIFKNNGSGGFTRGQEHFVGLGPVGIETADFNRDGILDLAVSISYEDAVIILLGTGYGTFLNHLYQPVAETPYAIAKANFNPEPELSIELRDRQILVKNIGDADAQQVTGQIDIYGGIFGLIDKQVPFSSEFLLVEEELAVPIPSVFGLGLVVIDVWVEALNSNRIQVSLEGFVVLIWLFL